MKIPKIIDKYNKCPLGAKAAVWYTISNILQKGISVITVPIYTRLLPTVEYGTYSVFISWLEIFEILATFRLFYGAYIVGLVKFDHDKDCYTSSLELLSSCITLFFFCFYLIFRNPINNVTNLTTPLTLLMFLYLFAIPALGFWKARQRVENCYIQMVIISLVSAALTPILGITFILLFNCSAVFVIFAKTIVQVGISAFLLVMFYRQFFSRINVAYWKYALKINIPLVPYYLSTVILNHSDRIVIQRICGSSEAAVYSVAYSAAMIMQLFSNAINSAVQPWLYKKIHAKNLDNVHKIIDGITALIAFLNFLLILFAPEAIKILAPSQYYEAIWIIPPVSASVLVMYLYQQFVNVEFYYEEGRMISIASIGSAVLNLVLNVWLIPIFGYFAAGYTTFFSYLVFGILHYFFMIKICHIHGQNQKIYDIRFMVFLLCIFLALASVILSVYNYPLIRYSIIILTCLTVIWKRKKIHQFLLIQFKIITKNGRL